MDLLIMDQSMRSAASKGPLEIRVFGPRGGWEDVGTVGAYHGSFSEWAARGEEGIDRR